MIDSSQKYTRTISCCTSAKRLSKRSPARFLGWSCVLNTDWYIHGLHHMRTRAVVGLLSQYVRRQSKHSSLHSEGVPSGVSAAFPGPTAKIMEPRMVKYRARTRSPEHTTINSVVRRKLTQAIQTCRVSTVDTRHPVCCLSQIVDAPNSMHEPVVPPQNMPVCKLIVTQNSVATNDIYGDPTTESGRRSNRPVCTSFGAKQVSKYPCSPRFCGRTREQEEDERPH